MKMAVGLLFGLWILTCILNPTLRTEAAAPRVDWVVTCEPEPVRTFCLDDVGNAYALVWTPAVLNHNFSVDSANGDRAIVKIAPDGAIIWAKGFSFPTKDPILTGAADGFFMAGQKWSGIGSNYDHFIARYTSNGTPLWETIIPAVVSSLNLDSSGNLRLSGATYSGTTNQIGPTRFAVPWPYSKLFLGTMTQTGMFLEALPLQQFSGFAQIMSQTGASGSTYNFITFDTMYGNLPTRGSFDCLLSKGTSGTETWIKQIGGSGLELGRAINLTEREEVVIAGECDSSYADFGAGVIQVLSQGYWAQYSDQGVLLGVHFMPAATDLIRDITTGTRKDLLLTAETSTSEGRIVFYSRNAERTWEIPVKSSTAQAKVEKVVEKNGCAFFTGANLAPTVTTTTIGDKNVSTTSGIGFLAKTFPFVLPEIYLQPTSVIIPPGSPLTLTVGASTFSEGTLSYQWFKDGAALPGATSSTLSFASVNSIDSGIYRVSVRNSHGETLSQEATVVVAAQAQGQVTTIAGGPESGYVNSAIPTQARFNEPSGVTVLRDGTIYVADSGNNVIRFITPRQEVGTAAGQGSPGYQDGSGLNALFNSPMGVALHPSGDLMVADIFNYRVRRIVPIGFETVTTVAGSSLAGFTDASTPLQALFNLPNATATDIAGNTYVADLQNHCIRKISPAGSVSTLAGSNSGGYADGMGADARFSLPAGLTLAPDGNLYVTERSNHRVRKVTKDGVVSTVCGTNTSGLKDGFGAAALLNAPNGITSDSEGNLYITELGNHAIRKIHRGGYVQTLCGNGSAGFADGDLGTARFYAPSGLTFQPDGSLIVADTLNQRIRRLTLNPQSQNPGSTLFIQLNPTIFLTGLVGQTFRIECSETVPFTGWVAITNIVLTQPSQPWTDPRPANGPARLYRAVSSK